MKKRNLLLVLLAAMLTVPSLLFASGSSEKVAEKKEVSICTPYLSSVTTKQMIGDIEEKLIASGFSVSINDSANDNSRLVSDIETSVVSGASAIIIVSVDPKIVETQINEAADAGVPVFGCDAGYIDSMQMNASSDNYQMGEMISKYLFDKMEGSGKIVHLTYRPHPGVVQRTYAMEDVLKEYPEISLISEHHVDVPNQINNSKEIVENLLTAYPEKGSISAVLCAWDEPAIGATQALQEAGRDEVLVVGVDGNEQAVKLINEGTNFKATLAQDFEGMADLVAVEVTKVLNGESVEKGEKYVPALLIEKE
jgi:ribose transport system substrate-binding protein